MNMNKPVSVAIFAAICVILLATVMMPVIDGASGETYRNEGTVHMADLEEFSITKSADSLVVNVNSAEYTDAIGAIVYSNEFVLYRATDEVFLLTQYLTTPLKTSTFSAEYADNTLTYTIDSASAVSLTLSDTLVVDPDGKYVSIQDRTQTVYAEDIDSIRAWGWNNGLFISKGTTAGTREGTSVTIDFEDHETTLNDISYTYNTTTAIANNIIVPEEFYIASEWKGFYQAIPVLVIISVLLGVVSIIGRARA